MTERVILEQASILTAFDADSIGTKVVDTDRFEEILAESIRSHDPSKDRAPEQHFILLPLEARSLVSAGVGRRTADPQDYVLREHRGRVEAYLRREKATEVEGVAAVVYTTKAYLSDPEVAGDKGEVARIEDAGATHIIVAVLAFAGPQAPLTPYRLVHNLAGGNREAELWDAKEIRAKASESKAYHDEWAVVAD